MPVQKMDPPANPILINFMHDYAGRSDDRFFKENNVGYFSKSYSMNVQNSIYY